MESRRRRRRHETHRHADGRRYCHLHNDGAACFPGDLFHLALAPAERFAPDHLNAAALAALIKKSRRRVRDRCLVIRQPVLVCISANILRGRRLNLSQRKEDNHEN